MMNVIDKSLLPYDVAHKRSNDSYTNNVLFQTPQKLYRLFTKSIRVLSATERQKLALLSVCQAVICLIDLGSLALLVLAAATIYQPDSILSRINISPVAFFSLLLLVFLFKNFLAFVIQQYQYRLTYAIAARISKQGVEQFLNGPFENYTDVDSSVWVRRISQQPVEFAQYILGGFQTIFTETLLVAGATSLLCIYNMQLFSLLLLILVPALLTVLYFTRKRLHQVRTSIKKHGELNLQYLNESIHGYVESNLFDRHEFFTERYGKQQQQLNRHLAQLQSTGLLPARMMESFAVGGFCILAILQLSGFSTSGVPVLALGAFLAGAYKLIPGIVRIINARNTIKTYAFAVADLSNKQVTPKNNEMLPASLHQITFQEVSLNIENSSILNNVCFELQAGSVTGLTAPSGKGKTSIVNLLLGFREINAGKILFNEVETNAAMRKKYWSRISYVKQQPFVLHDSIEQNITLEIGSKNKTVAHAMQAVRMHEWLEDDPGDHTISEAGRNISGGQQQRIALARALHKEADCYLLDEPFHALDKKTTDRLMDHLLKLAATGKMILVISHDPYTLQRCQKIIRLS